MDFFAKKRPLVEKIKTWNWLDIQREIFLCVEYRQIKRDPMRLLNREEEKK